MYLGAFHDDDVTHVEGEVDPVRDLEILSNELRLKDLQYMEKQIVSLKWARAWGRARARAREIYGYKWLISIEPIKRETEGGGRMGGREDVKTIS